MTAPVDLAALRALVATWRDYAQDGRDAAFDLADAMPAVLERLAAVESALRAVVKHYDAYHKARAAHGENPSTTDMYRERTLARSRSAAIDAARALVESHISDSAK